MWIMMYEAGYIEINDLHLTVAWLQSLLAAGYKFPREIRPAVQAVNVPPEPVIANVSTVIAHNITATAASAIRRRRKFWLSQRWGKNEVFAGVRSILFSVVSSIPWHNIA
jgi:hypothetical protein